MKIGEGRGEGRMGGGVEGESKCSECNDNDGYSSKYCMRSQQSDTVLYGYMSCRATIMKWIQMTEFLSG